MATASTTTDGLSFAPVSDRRGGPMDIDEPMQDIQPLPSHQLQQQQPPMVSLSPTSETLQQQQQQQLQPQSQPQFQHMDEGQNDPQLLMHPLQPQTSNQSTQSNQSFRSFESVDSSKASPASQQNSGGHLAPPPQQSHEKSRSRRWSITGRFFEKRKSVTEPFNVPGSQPSNLSSSYKSTNSNIVGDSGVWGGSWGGPESNIGGRASDNGGSFNHTNNAGHQNHNINTTNNTSATGSISPQSSNGGNGGTGETDSKNTSPPGSNGSSRRSSLADLPKAILSTFRRSSVVGPGDATSALAAAACASMAVIGVGSTGAGAGAGDTIAEEDEDQDEYRAPRTLMAIPRAPPQNSHITRPMPKSILKKRPSETDPAIAAAAAAAGDATASYRDAAESALTEAAAVDANTTSNAISGQHDEAFDQTTMSSESVHPMATADMDVSDINLLTPTDHRARLLTSSPPPSHPQQHLVNKPDKNPKLIGGAGSPKPSNNSDSVSSNNKMQQQSSSISPSQSQTQGAAFPPDFTPGVQSNTSKGRGGERSQGTVEDHISQDELLTQQMLGIGSRAQDLANQYYSNNTNNQTSTARTLAPIASTTTDAGGRRRSINFRETVEIIPAHRKGEYNRQSDKHATFKILTPDMKSEIRDELNTYKMREMAVHVESMANTAFH
ncbi:hypothetical protein BGZ96_012202 [Linnemannia gamsii]|uniref:Uncharacterized protein n=1 Tax=Linnemannia gamsii TaxID=64522 RepID=A0ABQ7JQU8_9FUNG|nr:hypothetical protein BGZ96_012202 [Linnemannia gamsii]